MDNWLDEKNRKKKWEQIRMTISQSGIYLGNLNLM